MNECDKRKEKLLKDLLKLMKKGLIPQELGEQVACVILKTGNDMKICNKCEEKIWDLILLNPDNRIAFNPEKGVMYFSEDTTFTEDTVVIDVVKDHNTYCMKTKKMFEIKEE